MTVKMPGALWLPISGNFTDRDRPSTTALILHVAVTEAASLKGWFSSPSAGASSHLYVRRDGTIEQYIDLDKVSWANGAGNSRAVTVETQGMGSGSWTKEQLVSLVNIARFVHDHYGVPLKEMRDSKRTSHGVGYHLLGVAANANQKARGVSQTGGELWSKAVGKICPGPSRVPQVADIIEAATGTVVIPVINPKPKPPVIVTGGHGLSEAQVKAVQLKLQKARLYKGAIDGLYGRVTEESVEFYQKGQLFGSLVADGVWGPKTEAHYQWVRLLQKNLNMWAGKEIAEDGDFRAVTRDRVREVMDRNEGHAYKGAVDGIPGPVFCKMLGIPVHP